MTSFPIFQRLTVDGYGMYPGTTSVPGVNVDLRPGLTLILGANGLGKTTLVTMLYRLCAGPTDIPKLVDSGKLGDKDLATKALRRPARRMFADRVVDQAENATSILTFGLGASTIEVTRRLNDLELTALSVDGSPINPSEARFQRVVIEAAGLSSFSDWILLLRHVTFYFEDRRALVWDKTAQSQIFRTLLGETAASTKWSEDEREILQLDSRMRNLQATLVKEEKAYSEIQQKAAGATNVLQDLQAAQAEQAAAMAALEQHTEELKELSSSAELARLACLRAELAQESAYRDLERRQLLSIQSVFPDMNDTARYLASKLVAEDFCVACGHEATRAAETMRERLSTDRCVICGSAVDIPEPASSYTAESIDTAQRSLDTAEIQLLAARQELRQSDDARDSLTVVVQELSADFAARASKITALVARLPPEDAVLQNTQSALVTFREQVNEMKDDLASLKREFSAYVTGLTRSIAVRNDEIRETFAEFAGGFLLDDCELTWAPEKRGLGQSGGARATYPAFDLDMQSATSSVAVRRDGPSHVSESQREFIDLAFRMTLMTVLGEGSRGSLVIDAPESSLDAVFVTRAADVLVKFANHEGSNRLLVTSNLIEGDLIPGLLHESGISDPADPRVVDLLAIAAPTAATRQMGDDYRAVRTRLFKRAGEKT